MKFPLLLSVILLIFILSANIFALTDIELKEKVTKPRWLSIENSRIVLNPVGVGHTGELVPHISNGAFASMSINAGYFYGEFPHRVPTVWTWKPVTSKIKPNSNIGEEYQNIIDMEWKDVGSKGEKKSGEIKLTQYNDSYGFIESQPFKINIQKTPIVYINIDGKEFATWGLKVGRKDQADMPIINGTVEKGNFAFDLRDYTDLKNNEEIYIRVFTVGDQGTEITLKGLGIGGISQDVAGFEVVEEFWQPSQITHIAKSSSRQIDVESTIFFSDEDSISQKLIVTKSNRNDLLLSGIWNKGDVDYLENDNVIIIYHEEYAIVLAFNGKPIHTRYASIEDYVIGKPSNSFDGYWTIRYPMVNKGDTINVSAVFVGGGKVTGEHINKAKNNIKENILSDNLLAREKSWNENLAKTPKPDNFSLTTIPYKETSQKSLEAMYYKAWTFIFANILPPMPENDYNYPQFACGKPSLWSEGHEKNRASAQWESIIAMQFGAYVVPEQAWNALAGFMNLVDEEGTIGGEGLPSRHCQTAWILYNLTGDKTRLIEMYPDMKRLLKWKIDDPRWIYKNFTENTEKDSEFVTQALTDITYMMDICNVLEYNEEITYWKREKNALYDKMLNWFWKEKGGDVHRIYQEERGPLIPNNSWSLAIFGLVPDILVSPELESLVKLYKECLDPNLSFLIYNFVKHPSRQLLMRGLLWTDMFDDAESFAEATLRDVTRAGEFAEEYDNTEPPKPRGVMPSIFGVGNVIDSSLWLNGVWISEGLPMLIDIRAGGIKNLSVRGKVLNISVSENGDVSIYGSAVEIIKIPDGFEKELENGMTIFKGKFYDSKKLKLELVDL